MSDRIYALIPAHNEGERISEVVLKTKKHLPVLVVDDGSSDDTATRAEEAGAIVLRQTPNQGKGQALRTGFQRSLELGASAVVTLDGDGQHDPKEIPSFLQKSRSSHPGLIIGHRDFSQMPLSRRLANTIGRGLFSMAIGQHIPDNQSGYRLIGRELMELMIQSRENGFEFEVDMIILAIRHDLGIDWIPIQTIYTGGTSHIRPFHHIYHFIRVTRLAWQKMHSPN